MKKVALHPGTEALAPLLEKLPACAAQVHVVTADAPDAEAWVARVLAGARLVVVGGEGPLLDKLHLFRVPGGVSGVGYSLARGRATGGPRGRGRVAFAGDRDPEAGVLAACLAYVAG